MRASDAWRAVALAMSVGGALGLSACSRPSPPSPSDAGPSAPEAREFGSVMVEVGHRYELAGRATLAGRFELAAFEVDEMNELFEDELPHARLPKEPTQADLRALAGAFAKTEIPDLAAAAKAKDARAFAAAFRHASETCNACHRASGHAFVEVPVALGKSVPSLDPLEGSAPPRPADAGIDPL